MADVAVQAPAVRRVPALPGRVVLGTLAIGAIAGLSAAVAVAAAARPLILSGPAHRGGAPGWLLGPLAGRLGSLVAGTARALGSSRRMALVLVGLNPLVLVYGIGGAHQEPLMLLGAVGAVALALRGRDATAGAAVLLAAGFKPSAVLLAPVVVL